MIKIKHLFSAVLLCMALLQPTVRAAEFSQIIIFGDSLSDGGQVVANIPTVGTLPVTFTNSFGQVWSQRLSNALGLPTTPSQSLLLAIPQGTNYAVGGYRTDDILSSINNLTPDPATTELVPGNPGAGLLLDGSERGGPQPGYLVANPNADANALYIIWGGGNDIRAGDDPIVAATRLVEGATLLNDSGANLIIVNNLPNIGSVPESAATGTSASRSTDSTAFNDTLESGLNASGGNVVLTNINLLFDEVLANPVAFGFGNIDHRQFCADSGAFTGITCNAGTLTDVNEYLFFDGIHPTQAGHQLIANYVQSIITAPTQISLLAETAIRNTHHTRDMLYGHIDALGLQKNPGWTPFASGGFNVLDYDRRPSQGGGEGVSNQALMGAGYQFNDHLTAGVAVSVDYTSIDFNRSAGGFELLSYGGHGFVSYDHNSFKVRGFAGISYLDYFDIERKIRLGAENRTESGDTNGLRLHAGTSLEIDLLSTHNRWQLGPVFGLTYQNIEIDGYRESGNSSTALRYGKQNRESTVLEGGLKAAYDDIEAGLPYRIQGSLVYAQELNDNADGINATLASLDSNYFNISGISPEKNWLHSQFSVQVQATTDIAITTGINLRVGDDDLQLSLNAGLNARF